MNFENQHMHWIGAKIQLKFYPILEKTNLAILLSWVDASTFETKKHLNNIAKMLRYMVAKTLHPTSR